LKWSKKGQKVKVKGQKVKVENVNLDHPKLLILLYFITYLYSFSLMVKVNRYKVSRKKKPKNSVFKSYWFCWILP